MYFCDRFDSLPNGEPSAPQIRYTQISGTAPQWAVAAGAMGNDSQVYFELEVIFADPVPDLTPDNILVEAGSLISAGCPLSINPWQI